MSGPTPRRRRHSAAVYRRRRLVVLLVALLVVGGLTWLFIAQPWRSDAATGPAATPPSQAESPSPGASTPPPEAPVDAPQETTPPADAAEPTPELTPTAEACVAGDLLVEAVTDQSSYPQGQNPQLSIKLTNQSTADCTLNVGTSAQAFTISSGPDVWWRSTDCQTEPSDMIVLLTAGQQVTSSAPLAWDRTRSSVDTCQGDRPQATSGTYHLSVAIGGLSSVSTAPFQLN